MRQQGNRASSKVRAGGGCNRDRFRTRPGMSCYQDMTRRWSLGSFRRLKGLSYGQTDQRRLSYFHASDALCVTAWAVGSRRHSLRAEEPGNVPGPHCLRDVQFRPPRIRWCLHEPRKARRPNRRRGLDARTWEPLGRWNYQDYLQAVAWDSGVSSNGDGTGERPGRRRCAPDSPELATQARW